MHMCYQNIQLTLFREIQHVLTYSIKKHTSLEFLENTWKKI